MHDTFGLAEGPVYDSLLWDALGRCMVSFGHTRVMWASLCAQFMLILVDHRLLSKNVGRHYHKRHCGISMPDRFCHALRFQEGRSKLVICVGWSKRSSILHQYVIMPTTKLSSYHCVEII
ncbi:hypothetical protein GOP47_0026971 [Adiantum capillus-veneris]|nr:hypothetical protein GOP47_0026971 [Adiantum capillus-veneris]